MFMRRCFNHLSISLIILIIICVGAMVAMGQDSAATWEDSETGLTWTVKDNGADVGYNEAYRYCDSLDLDGHSDWNLPTIDELTALYDKGVSKKYKVRGPLELGAPSIWSESMNTSGDVWSFYFNYGGKSLSPTRGCGTVGRALCVQRAKGE